MPPGSLNHEPDQNAIFFNQFSNLVSVSNNHERGHVSHIGMYRPKGRALGSFWSKNTLPLLVWNRVWFSRELRERT